MNRGNEARDAEWLPEGWALTSLDELGTWTGGGTPSKSNDAFWDGAIPWVSPKDMKTIKLDDTADHVTANAVEKSAAKLFSANSLAFVVRSGILEHTLPVGLVQVKATANQDLKVLTPGRSLNPEWLLYALLAEAPAIRRRCRKDGTTVTSIDFLKLKAYPLLIPPRAEQDRIVEAVEAAIRVIDSGLGSIDDANRSLATFRLAILAAAFRGSFTSAGGDPVANSRGDSDELPRGWRKVVLSDVADHVLGKMLDKSKNKGKLSPYLRNINVQWGRVELEDIKQMRIEGREKERYRVREGDVLICEGGEPGRCAVWRGSEEMFFQKALHRVRTSDELMPEYLAYFLQFAAAGPRLSKLFTGSTIKHLPGEKLAQLKLPLPPRHEQAHIVRTIDTTLNYADVMRRDVTRATDQAAAARRAILHRAFTGQLVPQDSNDEPASELLERIKSEKAEGEADLKAAKKSARAAKKDRAATKAKASIKAVS